MKKTHNGILFFLIVSCLLFSACAPANEPFADGRKPQNHPVIGGYSYVDSMELAYATMFAVDYYEKDITLITIADNQRYLLLPDALKQENANTAFGKQFLQNIPADVTILQKSPERVYLASSSCMDFWEELGVSNRVWFTSTRRQDWDLPNAAARMDDGSLEFVGKYNAPDFEYLLSEQCGLAVENTMIYHTPDTLEQLQSLGIPAMVEYSSYEPHPLGRLEWIRLWGLIAGCEEQAVAYFYEQIERMEQVTSQDGDPQTDKTGQVTSQDRDSQSDKTGHAAAQNSYNAPVKVAYFSINANGMIRVPNSASYIPKMIALAGGDYVFADGFTQQEETDESNRTNASSSTNMQMEPFYAAAKDADVLIYNGTIEGKLSSVDELIEKNALFADFKAIREGRVWCQDGDLFQHPTQAVQQAVDFAAAVADKPDDTLIYLKKLPSSAQTSKSDN